MLLTHLKNADVCSTIFEKGLCVVLSHPSDILIEEHTLRSITITYDRFCCYVAHVL